MGHLLQERNDLQKTFDQYLEENTLMNMGLKMCNPPTRVLPAPPPPDHLAVAVAVAVGLAHGQPSGQL